MRRWLSVGLVGLLGAPGLASDHNNLDQGRPLQFEDAYSIAYRAWEFQTGVFLGFDPHRRSRSLFRTEIQNGFAKNRSFGVGWDSGSGVQRVDLSYFEGVRREIGNAPAFGYRVEVGLPVSGGGTADWHARGVWTKTAGHYDKLHLNVELSHQAGLTSVGAVLGYSAPIGYPRRFDETFLAEVGVGQGPWIGWAGVGVRKQVSVTGVLDFGLHVDWLGASGARISVGYSMSF